MAKRIKTGGKDWKPGESGNPKGPAVLPPEIRRIRSLTLHEVKQVGDLVLCLNEAEVQAISSDPEANVLKRWIAIIALNGMRTGNVAILNALLDRLIGKVPETIKMSGTLSTSPGLDLSKLSDADLNEYERLVTLARRDPVPSQN